MGKTTSQLFKVSRLLRDARVIASGDPKKVARRAKNKYIGRKLISKLWRWP